MGMAPGPAIGRILHHVYERQLDGSVTTVDEGLALARTLVAAEKDA
jgi:hypothetical protein